jgi:hypothetical protein
LVDLLVPAVVLSSDVAADSAVVVRWLGSWILCDVTKRDGEQWLQSHDPTHVFGWISLTELCRTIGSRGVGITFHRAADVPGEFLSEWARRRIAGA